MLRLESRPARGSQAWNLQLFPWFSWGVGTHGGTFPLGATKPRSSSFAAGTLPPHPGSEQREPLGDAVRCGAGERLAFCLAFTLFLAKGLVGLSPPWVSGLCQLLSVLTRPLVSQHPHRFVLTCGSGPRGCAVSHSALGAVPSVRYATCVM